MATKPAASIQRTHRRTMSLPCRKMLQAIRPDVVISGEMPMCSLREAGVSDLEWSKIVMVGMRRVLEAADREQNT